MKSKNIKRLKEGLGRWNFYRVQYLVTDDYSPLLIFHSNQRKILNNSIDFSEEKQKKIERNAIGMRKMKDNFVVSRTGDENDWRKMHYF
ncbi:MAG: hypothetical protein ACD_71C00179G0015 [uncultured bacterium (gcode 4)]|uniref:Uncharacterized protein n=1 Tax=uncultured bacterium (gcode 4) TaxID=1234023 RepID=K1YMX5_9BACT|nr:MAG: hypothetical protein ACD_71C00179G0015 [uncultured bacterium (gcode 4)]